MASSPVSGVPRPARLPAQPEDWPAVLDGELTRLGEAAIPATDDGLIRGDGAFDAFLVRDGRPFAQRAHLDRLQRSCDALALAFPRRHVESDIALLLGAAPAGDVAVRVMLTRGGRRLSRLEPVGDADQVRQPVRLLPVTYAPTVVLDGVKSLSYAANMLASRRARSAGFDEAVLISPGGTVLEGPTCAIFWVVDGELRTPTLHTGILASITRRVIVEGMPVREGAFGLDSLLDADEAFLASTVRLAQPVAAVGDRRLGDAPGPVTLGAQELLAAAIADDVLL